MGPPSTNPSAPPSVTPHSSHASGSGRNYEAERLRMLLNASQEELHLQQRQFEEEKITMNRHFKERQQIQQAQFEKEKITMNRHFKERQQIQQAQFDAERMFYQSQIKALSGYHGGA